ncbi:MAG: GGDEF domain-containing protein [Alphaproteobacteria bacterium]|nr:GGDEF domain-containing protein [Alphaproteobacteria bacterium]
MTDHKHAPVGVGERGLDDGRILNQLEAAARTLGSVIGQAPTGRRAERRAPLVTQILETTEEVASFVTEQSARIAYLENLTLTDELTGLRNRRGFNEFLQRTLASAERYGDTGVLVFCDLDAFKDINDSYGHHVGDIVLKKVARVIEAEVRETDVVARLGGDEFAILMIQTNWRDGLKRAQMLNRAMNRTIVTHDGQEILVKASFGVEPFGPNDEAGHLVARADMCMYVNKRKKASVALNKAAE